MSYYIYIMYLRKTEENSIIRLKYCEIMKIKENQINEKKLKKIFINIMLNWHNYVNIMY